MGVYSRYILLHHRQPPISSIYEYVSFFSTQSFTSFLVSNQDAWGDLMLDRRVCVLRYREHGGRGAEKALCKINIHKLVNCRINYIFSL